MLRRVLGVTADDLDESVFRRLVSDRVAESQRLEFKSDLPGASQDHRREFARDVAAMANGGGGLLIFGVMDDDQDQAEALTPVLTGAELTRLSQLSSSLIEPYLPLEFHAIAIEGGSEGVIVVEVPPSRRRPFAVAEGSRLGYYRRVGKHKQSMSEAEVSQMYRERDARFADVRGRVELISGEAIARLDEDGDPAIVISIAPFDVPPRLFSPTRTTERRIVELSGDRIFGEPPGEVFFLNTRPGFKRVVVSPSFENRGHHPWMEFHDDGAFVGVILGRKSRDTADTNGFFYDSSLTAEMLARFHAYALFAKDFEVAGEIHIRIAVPPIALPAMLTTGRGRSSMDRAEALSRAATLDASADIADLLDLPMLLQVAAPILDDVWSAFGWPRNVQLSRDGAIRLRFFEHDWESSPERWARANGIETTETIDDDE